MYASQTIHILSKHTSRSLRNVVQRNLPVMSSRNICYIVSHWIKFHHLPRIVSVSIRKCIKSLYSSKCHLLRKGQAHTGLIYIQVRNSWVRHVVQKGTFANVQQLATVYSLRSEQIMGSWNVIYTFCPRPWYTPCTVWSHQEPSCKGYIA